MRGKSHRCLGKYLVQHYMSDTPERYVKAFLLGCIEPDRNPATYLKGSIRCQWLRGHNYRNARRFMRAISARLEKKESSACSTTIPWASSSTTPPTRSPTPTTTPSPPP